MGMGAFSSESTSKQKTLNLNQQQIASDQAVNTSIRGSPMGNVRVGPKGTLNQYTTNEYTTTVQGVSKDDLAGLSKELKELLTVNNTAAATTPPPPALPFTEPSTGGYTPPTSGVQGALETRVTDQVLNGPAASQTKTAHGILLGAVVFVVLAVTLFFFARKKSS